MNYKSIARHWRACALLNLVSLGAAIASPCPPMPDNVPADVKVQIQGEVGKLRGLTAGQASALVERTSRDVIVRLPNADTLYLKQMMTSMICASIQLEKNTSDAEKTAKLIALGQTVGLTIDNRTQATPGTRPPASGNGRTPEAKATKPPVPSAKPPRQPASVPAPTPAPAPAPAVSVSVSVSGIGRCDSKPRMLQSTLQYEHAAMIDHWVKPIKWTKGQADLKLPVLNPDGFDGYQRFEIQGGNAVSASQRIPTAEAVAQVSVDKRARDWLRRSLPGFEKSSKKYYTKLGFVNSISRTQDVERDEPYMAVRYLSEWHREAFNREMTADYYRLDNKLYCADERDWLAQDVVGFPSVLFGEFLVVTRDHKAIAFTKNVQQARSHVADVLKKPLLTASAETSVWVGATPENSDLEVDPANNRLARINLNSLALRAVKSDLGLVASNITDIVVYGVAMQKDTLNTSMIGLMKVDVDCARLAALPGVTCISPKQAGDALKVSEDPFLLRDGEYAWHSTAKLRLHFWQNHAAQYLTSFNVSVGKVTQRLEASQ